MAKWPLLNCSTPCSARSFFPDSQFLRGEKPSGPRPLSRSTDTCFDRQPRRAERWLPVHLKRTGVSSESPKVTGRWAGNFFSGFICGYFPLSAHEAACSGLLALLLATQQCLRERVRVTEAARKAAGRVRLPAFWHNVLLGETPYVRRRSLLPRRNDRNTSQALAEATR